MKKIMFAITTLTGGGAERVVSVWANMLSKKGYDVSLILYGRENNEYFILNDVKIYTVADNYVEYKKMGYFKRLSSMKKIIKNVKPEIIINFLPRMQIWMMMATFGLKVKRIETVRINPWEVIKDDSFFEGFLWKKCFNRAHGIIVQNSEQREFFKKKNYKKCVVIPNPLSPVYETIERGEYKSKPKNIIAVGRITEQKNYPMLIRAMNRIVKEYPELQLSIFGSGREEYLNMLNDMIKEHNLENNIKFKGRSNEIHKELCSSDLYIMSSDYEGMPNALAEAMASGLVCISTNCKTGPKDMIENGENGFLVPVNDDLALYEVVCEIMKMNVDELNKIASNARRSILDKCSEEQSVNKLINMIENL